MKPPVAEITYYFILSLGYFWSAIQIAADQPFDALVLFTVTWSFQSYRNAVKELL